jgi:transcriptional regulator with XRE-family HTH domain
MGAPRRRRELAEHRELAGFTQATLATRLGVTVGTVASWERGGSCPTARHRQPLAEALGVGLATVAWLIDPGVPAPTEGHHVPNWMSHYDSLLAAASRIAKVEKDVVPGLLQTKAYAAAVESSLEGRQAGGERAAEGPALCRAARGHGQVHEALRPPAGHRPAPGRLDAPDRRAPAEIPAPTPSRRARQTGRSSLITAEIRATSG